MTVQMSIGLGDKSETLLILLLVGHVLADFLVQTRGVARRKEESTSALLLHGFWTFITHLALLAPFVSWFVVGGVAVLSIVHTAVDAIRIHLMGKWGRSLAAFFLDQALHIAAAVILFVVLRAGGAHRHIAIPHVSVWLQPLRVSAVIFAGYVFNARGGTMVVRKLLEGRSVAPSASEDSSVDLLAMGEMIGYLERFLLFTLVMLDQWIAFGVVVAVKSLRTATQSETEATSCHRVIGTLASILVAVATGIVVRAVVF